MPHVKRTLASRSIAAASLSAALILVVALTTPVTVQPTFAASPVETGRFVWHDLLAKDVAAAKRFYGQLLGWQFDDGKRDDRPYVLARAGGRLVGGIVDISNNPDAAAQWISYLSVADLDQSVAQVTAAGGKVLVAPKDFPNARAAVVADPDGAPLGLAQAKRPLPDLEPAPNHLFWDEYLAKDASKALDFYKRLGSYQSAVSDSRLGTDYHVLRTSRPRAGLFQLPASVTGIEPNWLPYVLVDDPSALAARVLGLGGHILLPAAPERRNNSLVVVADPGGAPLALQKFPF